MWGLSTGEEYGQKLSEFFLPHTYLSYTINLNQSLYNIKL